VVKNIESSYLFVFFFVMRGNRDRDNHSQFETVSLTYYNDMSTSMSYAEVSWWKSEEDIVKESKIVFINQDGVEKLAEKVCFFLQNFTT